MTERGMIFSEDIERLERHSTSFELPENYEWGPQQGFPPSSLEYAVLDGDMASKGTYLTLVRWCSGFMSAPHSYATDRVCKVLSGAWWINSDPEFEPDKCIDVAAGAFVKRRAHTAFRRSHCRSKIPGRDHYLWHSSSSSGAD